MGNAHAGHAIRQHEFNCLHIAVQGSNQLRACRRLPSAGVFHAKRVNESLVQYGIQIFIGDAFQQQAKHVDQNQIFPKSAGLIGKRNRPNIFQHVAGSNVLIKTSILNFRTVFQRVVCGWGHVHHARGVAHPVLQGDGPDGRHVAGSRFYLQVFQLGHPV